MGRGWGQGEGLHAQSGLVWSECPAGTKGDHAWGFLLTCPFGAQGEGGVGGAGKLSAVTSDLMPSG